MQMKKTLGSILVAAIFVLMMVAPVFATVEFVIDENGILLKYNGSGGAVVIPDGVTRIEGQAFCDCTNLTSITIPDSVLSIGENAFARCSNLTDITMSEGLTNIEVGAFLDCIALSKVMLPNSIEYIGDFVFTGCSSLDSIMVASGNTAYKDVNGVLFNKSETVLIAYPGGRRGPYSVPNNIIKIGMAFYACSGLTDVSLPNSLTSIEDHAFNSCISISSVTFPYSIKDIGFAAFCDCSSLVSLVIPDGVTNIGGAAFYGCSKLKTIILPDSVMKIEDSAFGYCDALTDVYYKGNKEQWNAISFGSNNNSLIKAGIHYNSSSFFYDDSDAGEEDRTNEEDWNFVLLRSPNIEGEHAGITGYNGKGGIVTIPDTLGGKPVNEIIGFSIKGNHTIIDISIPTSVVFVGASAFEECTALQRFEIPNSVIEIGTYAFQNCSALTTADLPGSIKKIGMGVFQGCSQLQIATLGYGITEIPYAAFYDCNALKSVIIPSTVTSIGDFSFSHCTSLSDVYYGGSQEEWNAITIGIANAPLLMATVHYNTNRFIRIPAVPSIPSEAPWISEATYGEDTLTLTVKDGVSAPVFLAAYDENGRMVKVCKGTCVDGQYILDVGTDAVDYRWKLMFVDANTTAPLTCDYALEF